MKCEITECISHEDCGIIDITKKPPKTNEDCSYFDNGKKSKKKKRLTHIDTSEE
jgi:hypothetical protein